MPVEEPSTSSTEDMVLTDQAQDFPKQITRLGDVCHLESRVATMADNLGAGP